MSSTWTDIPEPPQLGRLRYDRVAIASPAAGAPVIFPLDSAFDWLLLAISFRLVADANVAARLPSVDLTDPDGVVWHRCAWATLAAANSTTDWIANTSKFESQSVATAAVLNMTSAPNLWYSGGMQMRVNVAAIQAGDQISAVRCLFAKYLTGPRD